jgi:LPXTG-motif cell wall-anchored protein
MSAHARLTGLATAGLVLLGATLVSATPAHGIVPVSITGSAPASTHGPGSLTFSYDIELSVPVDSTTITTHQPTELPADTTGVRLDGAPVPAAQISRPDPVDITVQTGPLPTDGLAAGSHTLTFTVTVGTGPGASTTASATIDYQITGTPGSVTSADVPVAVNQPDLAVTLTPDSGEDQVGLLGTGRDIDLLVDVDNRGYGTPSSTLTIDLPTGLALGSAGVSRDATGDPLSCAPAVGNPQQIHCALGPVNHGADGDPTLDIDLTSTAAAPIGQLATVTVSAAPDAGQGTDQNPANNSASAQLRFTGSARLSYFVTPAKTTVALGGQTTVTLTIHNAGPQPAPSTLAFTVLVGSNFSIAGFTGQTGPGVPMAVGPGGGPTGTGAELLWFAGDIPTGGSASATLTVQARLLGTGRVGIAAFSGASDPNCPDFDCSPATVALQAIAAPAPASAGGTVILPATGQASQATVLFSFGLLLAGCGLVLLGRRRVASWSVPARPGSHRRR